MERVHIVIFNLILIFVLVFSLSFSQNIEYSEENDSVYVDALIDSSQAISFNFDKIEQYLFEACLVSKKIGYQKGLVSSYLYLGDSKHKNDNELEAISYYDSAMILLKNIGTQNELASLYYRLGISYHFLSDFRKAIDYGELGLTCLFGEHVDSTQMAFLYLLIGNASVKLGSYDMAMEKMNLAYDIFDQTKNSEGLYEIHNSFSAMYYSMDGFDKAKYKTQRNKLEINGLNKDKSFKEGREKMLSTTIFLSFLFVMLLLILFFVVVRSKSKLDSQKKYYEEITVHSMLSF